MNINKVIIISGVVIIIVGCIAVGIAVAIAVAVTVTLGANVAGGSTVIDFRFHRDIITTEGVTVIGFFIVAILSLIVVVLRKKHARFLALTTKMVQS